MVKKYKEKKDVNGDLIGYVRAVDGMDIPISTGNRHYKDVIDWISGGNTPDPADAYAGSLSAAKTKRIAELKADARSIYKRVSDSYASQYSMEKLRGDTPTSLPGSVNTWYTNMKSAFQTAKTAINAETDIATIATINATWPTGP